MASPLSVQCEGCGTVLKLTEKTAGKRIACPLCQEQFVVPLSAAAVSQLKKGLAEAKKASPPPTGSASSRMSPAAKEPAPPSKPSSLPVGRLISEPTVSPSPKSRKPVVDDIEESAFADFEAYGDEIEIVDDIDDEFELPRSAKPASKSGPAKAPAVTGRQAAPPKPKKEKKYDPTADKQNAKKVLVVGGVLVSLAILAGFVMLGLNAISKIKAKAEQLQTRFDLAWMPKYPTSFVSVRVSELWNSSFGQAIAADAEVKHNLGEMRQKLGFGPEDVEQFIYCNATAPEMMGHDLTKVMQAAKGAASMGMGGASTQTIMLLKLSKPFDLERIAKVFGNAGRAKVGEKEYMQFDAPGVFSSWETSASFLIDEKTIVLGSVSTIKSILGLNGAAPDCPELTPVDSRQQIVFAMIPKNIPIPPASPFVDENGKQIRMENPVQVFRQEVKLVASSLNFNDGLQFKFMTECHSEETAKKVHAAMAQSGNGAGGDIVPVRVGFGDIPFSPPGTRKVEEELDRTKTLTLNGGLIEATAAVNAASLEEVQNSIKRAVALAAIGEFKEIHRSDVREMLAAMGNDEEGEEGEDEADEMAEGEEDGVVDAAEMEADEEEKAEGDGAAEKKDATAQPKAKKVKKEKKKPEKPAEREFKPVKDVIALLEAKGCNVQLRGEAAYEVVIENPNFSNADMEIVAALRGVSIITITNSSVTDRGLIPLQKCGETLLRLSLNGTDLTNDGMKYLTPDKLSALQFLNLSKNAKITDDCLDHLDKLWVETLVVRDTQITPAGANRLRQKRMVNVIGNK